jgi:predicted metal-dependent phosphoesterase TrpH
LKRAGIIGMEIYYNGYTPDVVAELERLAERYDLLALGGSDFHGLDDVIGSEMGSVEVPWESVQKLIHLSKQKGW